MTAHQSWKLGAHHTTCRQLNRLESVLSRGLSSSETPPGRLAALSLFLPVWLVSASSRQLDLSENVLYDFSCLTVTLRRLYCLIFLGREGPSAFGLVQELLKATLICLLPILMSS